MEKISIGGRSYSDPDVLSLIRSADPPLDPRTEVILRAKELNSNLRGWGGTVKDPRERIEALGSLAGVTFKPIANDGEGHSPREALIYQHENGEKYSFYDPSYPSARINFSLAHEIVHTFFPNSRYGARFRDMVQDDSREANELERLCDLGASELLMPTEEFVEAVGRDFGIHVVARVAQQFGSSFEATVYRLVTASQSYAVAGLLRYRLSKPQIRALASVNQQSLFEDSAVGSNQSPIPRYRRQSFHSSQKCDLEYWIPWNKSFSDDSCVYQAASGAIAQGVEALPNKVARKGNLEVCHSPFQRDGCDPEHPDLLFFWRATPS